MQLNYDDDLTLGSVGGLSLNNDDGLTLEPQTQRGSMQNNPIPTGPPTVGEIEADALEEVSEVLTGFRQRAQREDQRYEDAVDSEYFICICFQTRAQKNEFLFKKGWLDYGDKYIDGLLVATHERVFLESPTPPMPNQRAGDVRLLALTEQPDA